MIELFWDGPGYYGAKVNGDFISYGKYDDGSDMFQTPEIAVEQIEFAHDSDDITIYDLSLVQSDDMYIDQEALGLAVFHA